MTLRTLLTGMLRINLKQSNAEHSGFICQELFELIEAPVGMFRPLSFSNRSRPYAFEILNGNVGPKCLSSMDDALADNVIGVTLKSLLFARQLFQVSLGRLCSSFLKCLAKPVMALACLFNLFAGESLALGISSDVHNTQINAENLIGLGWCGIFDLAGCQNVEFPSMEDKVGFAALVLKQEELLFSADEWDGLAPVNGPNVYSLIFQIEPDNSTIVGDCTSEFKSPLVFFVQFVGISNLRDCSDGWLSRQSKCFSNDIIACPVKRKLAKLLLIPSNFRNSVARRIDITESLFQREAVLLRRNELYLSRQFHNLIYSNV